MPLKYFSRVSPLSRILFLFITFIFSVTIARAQKAAAIQSDFPDPTVIMANDKYYAFATNSGRNGQTLNVQVAVSDNLEDWKMLGDAMPQKPGWANRDFWAPHVIYNDLIQQYVLFFSAQTNDPDKGMGIGVAFSKEPEGPYTAQPTYLIADTGFTAIDAMVIKDPKTHKYFMTWGSGFQPIKIRALADSMTSFSKGSSDVEIMPVGEEEKYSRLVEGPWIDYDNGFYYLYYSGDNCCEENANYAVLIARSKHIQGPYTRMGHWNKTGNSIILEQNELIKAPGHNSIIKDRNGNKWMAYHAIPAEGFKKRQYGRWFYLDRVTYKNGWPVLNIHSKK